MHLLRHLCLLGAACLLAACTASSAPWLRNSPASGELAAQWQRFMENARRDSLAWDVTKRPARQLPWLVPGQADRLRLRELEAFTADTGEFNRRAAQVLGSMNRRAEENAEVLAAAMKLPAPPSASGLVAAEVSHVAALGGKHERERWRAGLLASLPQPEPHPGAGRRMLSALPAVPFVKLWIWNHARHEWRGPNWREFDNYRVYLPPTGAERRAAGGEPLDAADLLAMHSPIIVQELEGEGTPDPRDDMIGTCELIPDARGRPVGHVNTVQPTVYAWQSEARVGGEWLTQLNYQLWYHDHPELKPGDPEAGSTEGIMFRILLAANNDPMLAEAVYACGCYHRIYPTESLELSAEREFGGPVSGEYSLARHIPGRIDPVIPELAGDPDPGQPHPVVYVRSGFHLPAFVAFGEVAPAGDDRQHYQLAHAVELESLPWGRGRASFFARDGLVRGADRPEAWMMYPSGIYHAGTPRIRGAHKIHFDQYDYDDPTLLDALLRLPTRKESKE